MTTSFFTSLFDLASKHEGFNFDSYPNIQFYNGYIYGGRGTGGNNEQFLYRLKISDLSYNETTDNSFNRITGLVSFAIHPTNGNIYCYSPNKNTIIPIYNSNLSYNSQIDINVSGETFNINNGKYICLSGGPNYNNLYIACDNDNNTTGRIYSVTISTGATAVFTNTASPIKGMTVNSSSGFLYVLLNNKEIHSINLSGGSTLLQTLPSPSSITTTNQITLYKDNIYVQYKDSNNYVIRRIPITSPSTYNDDIVSETNINTNLAGITFNTNDTMYIREQDTPIIYQTTYFCFNEKTKILYLNKKMIDEYIPVEKLKKGDFVKTFKHGFRKIIKIIKGTFRNNPDNWNMCMYKMAKTETNGLTEDLIVTGGHSILVDSISETEQAEYDEMNLTDFSKITIDGKHLLLACVSEQFVAIQDNNDYTYYHLLLENNNDVEERFGIWANGILTETPNEKTLK